MGQVFRFVQDFGERWELVAFQAFVKYLLAGIRVVHAVYVVVGVDVEVVVLEEQVASDLPANIGESVTPDAVREVATVVLKRQTDPQRYVFLAVNDAPNDEAAGLIIKGVSEGVQISNDEWVLG
ncbi:MAG: hypothetical protein F4X64_16775 [Chloroflexi bacterium]|nr:hypothetical protein [Chloroflexota bacterium]